MFPFKVVPKKGKSLTTGSFARSASAIIPVENSNEYSVEVQLAIAAEVVLHNKQQVVALLEADLEDLAKVVATDFLSVVRLLQELGWLHLFVKNYHASIVDEFAELMRLASSQRGVVDCSPAPAGQAATSQREERDDAEWPDMVRRRNGHFIDDVATGEESMPQESEREDDTSDRVSIFDYELSCLSEFDLVSEQRPSRVSFASAASKPRKTSTPSKKKEQTGEGRQRTASQSTADFNYYEYLIEKATTVEQAGVQEEAQLTSAFEHCDVEASTKSEDVAEESTVECMPKSEQTVEVVQSVVAREDAAQDVIESANATAGANKKSRKRRAKRQKNAAATQAEVKLQPPVDCRPIEPLTVERVRGEFGAGRLRELARQAEKQKSDSKVVLRELLAKVGEAEDLAVFEKTGYAEINSLDSLSKKMKQKARKRLRTAILAESVKRNIAIEQQSEDDDDDFEDEDAEFLHYRALLKDVDPSQLPKIKMLLAQRRRPS